MAAFEESSCAPDEASALVNRERRCPVQHRGSILIRALRRLKKILGASRRGSLTFCNNFAICSFSAKA